MKRIMIITISLFFILGTIQIWAQEGEHGRSTKEVISEIEREQGVSSVGEINPDKVSPEVMEELGDSVMGLMIGDERRHAWMDEMMGGEGSEQLASTHRRIAYTYLQNDGKLGSWGPGIMGPGMMGGWYGPGRFTGMTGLWFWIIGIVILAGIVVLVVFLVRLRHKPNAGMLDAKEILRIRYAKGELSREEYQQMREELK